VIKHNKDRMKKSDLGFISSKEVNIGFIINKMKEILIFRKK